MAAPDSSAAPDRMLDVLVTGFGPFPGVADNPSAALARALAARPSMPGLALRAAVLPTTWAEAARFPDRLAAENPDLLVMLGVATRRRSVCVETLAVAEAGPFPDAEGHLAPAVPAGTPSAVSCAAEAGKLVRALRGAGLSARASRDAGRYICNALAHAAYLHAAGHGRPLRAVFVHIPQPDAAGALALPRLVRGLEALIAELARQTRDTAPGA